MRGIQPRGLGSTQISDWNKKQLIIPSRVGDSYWTWEDPLNTLTNLNLVKGTWVINSGVLETTISATDDCIFTHKWGITAGAPIHILQLEMFVPIGFNGGVHHNMPFGFQENASNYMFIIPHYDSGSKVAFYNGGFLNTIGTTWVEGQWYTLRLKWDNTLNDKFTGYISGTEFSSLTSVNLDNSKVYIPYASCYRNGGGVLTYKFRNMKYWGGSSSDIQPSL